MTTYITITGHRLQKLGGFDLHDPLNIKVFDALDAKMLNAVNKFEDVVFRIGMAIGVDQMAAWICIKREFTFDAYLPCENQEKPWPTPFQHGYRKLLTYARNVYVTHEGPYPGAWCMHKRNEQMVDGADGIQTDYLLSVYDGTGGGTGNCVKYAQEKGVTIVNINPREL
jgi:uncharacterized phage-like protein YoqJ